MTPEFIANNDFYLVVTSNCDRAHAIQEVLPGGKSVHVPLNVDEERVKTIKEKDPVSLAQAVAEVRRIAEGKARMDWQAIGGREGAIAQIETIGKPRSIIEGFHDMVRFYGDAVHIVIMEDGTVRVLNKLSEEELVHVPDLFSGRESAVLAAIACIRTSLLGPDRPTINSVVGATRYTNTHVDRRSYEAFVMAEGKENILKKAGAMPIKTSPFIDDTQPVTITISGSDGTGRDITIPAHVWAKHQESRRVSQHGTFVNAIGELLTTSGRPISPNGAIIF